MLNNKSGVFVLVIFSIFMLLSSCGNEKPADNSGSIAEKSETISETAPLEETEDQRVTNAKKRQAARSRCNVLDDAVGGSGVLGLLSAPQSGGTAAGNSLSGNVGALGTKSIGRAGSRRSISDLDYSQFNTENYDRVYENQFLAVKQNPLSTFSIDVDAASYANIRRFINNNQIPPKDAVRIEEMINYFSYNYPIPNGKHPFSIFSEISDCPWKKEHKLIHIGLQGKKMNSENMPASNLVFLLDVSGSMNSPNKLSLLKKSFRLLVNQLRESDRVSIVVYAGAAGLILSPTSGSKKAEILRGLDQLQAGGSTAGGAGIQLAYKMAKENFIKNGNNRVILATDGDFNIGISSDGDLVRMIEEKRNQGVFLTVLGFGMGNYKDSKMEKLADKGNGNYAYIDNILEAKKVFINELGSTLFTIAKDVKIQIEFNPHYVSAYRLIGYENRMLQSRDFNDDKKDAGELGAGHTVTALYEIVPVGVKIDLPGVDKLKYQKVTSNDEMNNEWLLVKFRYKNPADTISKKIQMALKEQRLSLNESSENFRFSAAVAGFGMLLRDSEFKGQITFTDILKLAENSLGDDKYGYRKEFLNLVEKGKLMSEDI